MEKIYQENNLCGRFYISDYNFAWKFIYQAKNLCGILYNEKINCVEALYIKKIFVWKISTQKCASPFSQRYHCNRPRCIQIILRDEPNTRVLVANSA